MDPQYIEKGARENSHYVRTGELVYTVSEPGATSRRPQQNNHVTQTTSCFGKSFLPKNFGRIPRKLSI